MSHPKIQHYVSQFLLKNFSRGRDQIYDYDKRTDNVFRTNIRNVAAERAFYDITIEGVNLTVEPKIGEIEAEAAELIRKIVQKRSIRFLTESDAMILAVFAAVQRQRGNLTRDTFKKLAKGLREKSKKLGFTEEELSDLPTGGEEEVKLMAINALTQTNRIVPYFYEKTWLLFEAPTHDPLFIGDNVIGLFNQRDSGPYGNLGLAVEGIEIYLPVHPRFSLAFYCPSFAEKAIARLAKIESQLGCSPTKRDWAQSGDLREIVNGFQMGEPVALQATNVERLNAIQVMFASRFVYSRHDNFELVRRMIEDDERYRSALTIRLD